MEEVRIGVIGCGKMGTYHLANWAQICGVRLVGVVDPSDVAAERAYQRFSCQRYPDVASLLGDVDAVSIATPSSCHAEIALQCRDAGVHALIEKPMCLTAQEATRLAAAFRNGAPVLQVGHIERYNPAFLRLKDLLHDEQVLSIRFYRFHPFHPPREPLDVIFDLMIHDLDLLRALEGDFTITAAAGQRVRTDSFDQATAMARFGDGGVAHFLASRVSRGRRRMIVANTRDAEYRADLVRGELSIYRWQKSAGDGGWGVHYELAPTNPLKDQLADFVRSIAVGDPPRVSVIDGMAVVVLAQEVEELAGEFARGTSHLSHSSTGGFREVMMAAGGVFSLGLETGE